MTADHADNDPSDAAGSLTPAHLRIIDAFAQKAVDDHLAGERAKREAENAPDPG